MLTATLRPQAGQIIPQPLYSVKAAHCLDKNLVNGQSSVVPRVGEYFRGSRYWLLCSLRHFCTGTAICFGARGNTGLGRRVTKDIYYRKYDLGELGNKSTDMGSRLLEAAAVALDWPMRLFLDRPQDRGLVLQAVRS